MLFMNLLCSVPQVVLLLLICVFGVYICGLLAQTEALFDIRVVDVLSSAERSMAKKEVHAQACQNRRATAFTLLCMI